MTFAKKILRLFGSAPNEGRRGLPSADNPMRGLSTENLEEAERWLAAKEAGHLKPPEDVHDSRRWDEYWKRHMSLGAIGAMEDGLSDAMASDPSLPVLLSRRGARSVLCVGNGCSIEAVSLALLGFNVTALDIAPVLAEARREAMRSPEGAWGRIPGFSLHEDGSATFDAAGPIDPDLCPPMHRGPDHPPRGGGSISFITGDLIDPDMCAGPFDVVIERRTVQLFPDGERSTALERLIGRLGDRGTFVSHQHRGGWRPGEPRVHYAQEWLRSRGFLLRSDGAPDDTAPRLAHLIFSTG